MYKRLFSAILILLSFSLFAQKKEAAKATTKVEPVKIDYTQLGTPMPELILVTYDTITKTVRKETNWWGKLWHKNVSTIHTNVMTNSDYDYDGNLFVMMFNPNCSHCVEETEVLKRNIDLFKKTKIVMVANNKMKTYLNDFVKQRNTKAFPTFSVGLDSNNFTNQAYLYKALPQINIYNKERKLIKIYNGDISIDSLKAYIQ